MKFLKFSLLTAVLLSVVVAFRWCGGDAASGFLTARQALRVALK